MKTDRPTPEVRDRSAVQLLSQEGPRGPEQEPRPKGGRPGPQRAQGRGGGEGRGWAGVETDGCIRELAGRGNTFYAGAKGE